MSAKDKRCPICNRPPVAEYHPFCSKRCTNVDLGRWLGGQYAIPAEEPPDALSEDDESPPRLH